MAALQPTPGSSAGPIFTRGFDAHPPTEERKLDSDIRRLRERAREFARLPIQRKVELLVDIRRGTSEVAEDWVRAACRAKGISIDTPVGGEEWFAGPALILRHLRFLMRALDDIQRDGAPALGDKRLSDVPGGGLAVRVTPYDGFDAAMFSGITAETRLQPGISRADVPGHQASFYRKQDPQGGLSVVLGAGNIACLGPVDVFQKMFVEGNVCILKMNPVNEYVGPFIERAFRALVDAGYFAVAYGGADVGSFLCGHPGVDNVHITGSDKTHDAIVWGPPGAEREDRRRRNDPVLRKPITSELGNVSPVLLVPGPYTDEELESAAENVAGMVTHNASFNCNSAKLLVVPRGWKLRETFINKLSNVFAKIPPRKAYYPGAVDRYQALTAKHTDVRKIGGGGDATLPWTLVLGLDPENPHEQNFSTEPFCSILSEVAVGSDDPIAFIRSAVEFVNERVWGTLVASLFVHPEVEADTAGTNAVDEALRDLRYGTVALNTWPAMGYALCSTPWGGHPSTTLANVQSGMGWVNNTVMLEGIEKCVIRTPLHAKPKPIHFPSHKTLHVLGRRLVAFESSTSWLKVPGLALAAFRG